jgi:shikimate dehydrogenase
MHRAALHALGLSEWSYQRLPVPPELFAETVRALPASGFAGANVTIPHKAAALALATDATPAARAIGAANTLSFPGDGAIEADNTDAPGLLAALPEPPRDARALVLGAGGSARAAVWALREAGAAEVLVWNRTGSRARDLAGDLGAWAVEAPAPPVDLLVNCTAVGLAPEDDLSDALPGLPQLLAAARCVVDLAYGEHETRLIAQARAAGAHTVDGLEVLARQGALSLERWTGRAAPLEVMRSAASAR